MNASQLEDLRPSVRNRTLGETCRKNPSLARQAASSLRAGDQGLCLLHSLDIEGILSALKHKSPHTRAISINAFIKVWFRQTATSTPLIDAVGGAQGLANIFNELAFQDAKKLAKIGHNHRGASDPRTQVLDQLVSLLVPSISNGGPTHPVSRLGSTLATNFLPACSPRIVLELLKLVDTKRDKNHLRRLLHTQPEVFGNLLLTPYDVFENPSLVFDQTDLKQLFSLHSTRTTSTPPGQRWGIDLFIKCMSAPEHPRLNFVSGIAINIDLGVSLLETVNTSPYWPKILELLISLTQASKEQGTTLSFRSWKPVIVSIARKLSKCESGEIHGMRAEKLTDYLKEIGSLQLSSMDSGVAALLPALVPRVRATVLRSLYRVDDLRTWKHPYPAAIKVATIALLPSTDGEPVLKQIERRFGNEDYFSQTSGDNALSAMFNLLNSVTSHEPTDRDDAASSTVRGRWANLEGDEVGKAQFKEWLERWKLKTHHQREPDGRVKYTRALLIIAAIVEDYEIQKATWAWVFERFIKDVDVRPQVFQSHMELYIKLLVGNSKEPVASARVGDEIVAAFIETMAEARKEPGFTAHTFRSILSILRNMLVGRLELCQRFGMEHTAKQLITPLMDLYVRAEKIMLDDPGTFGMPMSHPARYIDSYRTHTFNSHQWSMDSAWGYKKNVSLSPFYRKILVRFLEDLGQTRDGIYADLRATIGLQTQKARDKFPWPYLVERKFLMGLSVEEDAPRLMEYLQKIVRDPLGDDPDDIYNTYNSHWTLATNLYADIARNRGQDRVKMLLPILEHYRSQGNTQADNGLDLTPFFLTSTTFMRTIFSSEALVEAFFQSYRSNPDNFSNFEIVPGFPGPPQRWIDAFQASHNRNKYGSMPAAIGMLNTILPPVTCRGSHIILRHLALVCAVLWLGSREGVETADQSYDIIEDDPIKVNFVSLYALTGTNEKNRPSLTSTRAHQKFLTAYIDLLSKEEIINLSDSIKSLIPVKDDQPHRDLALRVLAILMLQKSSHPMLLEEDIFEVLRDVKRSTIHRHFFTEGMLATVTPEESRRLTRRFVEVISEGIAAQAEKSEKGASGKMKKAEKGLLSIPKALRAGQGNDQKKEEEEEPTIKLSTIKYLATIVAQPVTTFTLEETSSELTRLASGKDVHPSVQEVILQNLVQTLKAQIRLQPEAQLGPIWRALEELAIVACSLDERRMLTEKDWTRSKMPQITLRNSRPSRVFDLDIVTLPIEVRARWASLVDNMLGTQVKQTHRWLLEYLKRQKIPESELQWLVQAQFGPLLPDLYTPSNETYKQNRRYLQANSWSIRILGQQTIGFTYADKLHKLTAQLDGIDEEWYRKQDGKDFIALRTQWTEGYLTAWDTLVGIYGEFGGEDIAATLKSTIDVLLHPSNMLITAGQPESRNVPWGVVQTMVDYLTPPTYTSLKERREWRQHIQPLLESVLDRVSQAQRQDGLSSVLYYDLLTKVRLLLLPIPIVYGIEATYAVFVDKLFPLAQEAQNRPPALSPLQRFLDDSLPLICNLLPDTPALMTELCKKGEATDDFNARLLAYRLVQYFGGRASISLTKEQQERIKQIMIDMESHSDEYVRLLALSKPRANDCAQQVIYTDEDGSSMSY